MGRFSLNDDEMIIQEIKKYPFLFNPNDENYKNVGYKENTWQKVASVVDKSVPDCKKRWRNIKDAYVRIKRTMKSTTDKRIKWNLYHHLSFLENIIHEKNFNKTTEMLSDNFKTDCESADDLNDVELNELPSNLLSTKTPNRQSKSSSTIQENDSLTSDSRSPIPQTNRTTKRHRKEELNDSCFNCGFDEKAHRGLELFEAMHHRTAPTEDDVDLFMKSISMTVKKLPPALVSKAKLEILTVVTSLQSQAGAYDPNHSHCSKLRTNDHRNFSI